MRAQGNGLIKNYFSPNVVIEPAHRMDDSKMGPTGISTEHEFITMFETIVQDLSYTDSDSAITSLFPCKLTL
jgi:hypothetical protein